MWYDPIIAGAAAGFAVDCLIHPIDTIKTRSMSAQGFRASGGLSTLYRGFSVTLLGSIPSAMVFFTAYEACKRRLVADEPSSLLQRVGGIAGSSAMAEAVSCVVRLPMDTVRMRLMLMTRDDGGVNGATGAKGGANLRWRNLLGAADLRALPSSLGITLVREIPFAVIQYSIYEVCKMQLNTQRADKDAATAADGPKAHHKAAILNWWLPLVGSMAGTTAAIFTTPFDVLRTQWLTSPPVDRSLVSHVALVWRRGGARGLFAGVGPRVAYIGTGGAVFLPVYDAVSLWLCDHSAANASI